MAVTLGLFSGLALAGGFPGVGWLDEDGDAGADAVADDGGATGDARTEARECPSGAQHAPPRAFEASPASVLGKGDVCALENLRRARALRDRHGDVGLLARHFWQELGGDGGVPADFAVRLESYRWPGNVRELRNAVARRLALGDSAAVTALRTPSASLAREGRPAAATYAAGAIGLAALGAFAYLDVSGWTDYQRLRDDCGQTRTCSRDDVDALRTKFAGAAVALGVGVAALAIVTALFVSDRNHRADRASH